MQTIAVARGRGGGMTRSRMLRIMRITAAVGVAGVGAKWDV